MMIQASEISSIATRIIRFKDRHGRIRIGHDLGNGFADRLVEENVFGNRHRSGQKVEIIEILAPLAETPTIYGIGCNYQGHCSHDTNPEVPTIFFKNRKSLAGPFDDVVIPDAVNETDYEVELGVVIGKDCKDISKEDALDCVLGYVALNDVSARWWQGNDNGQWSFSKSFDGHCPIGPVLVTKEELADGSGLDVILTLNGEEKQKSNTAELIFSVPEILEFISMGTTIEKGTIIATGTPPGTGMGIVKAGDVMEAYVQNIGTVRNRAVKQIPDNYVQYSPVTKELSHECLWLNQFAFVFNTTSIQQVQDFVRTAIESVDPVEWKNIQVSPGILNQLLQNFTENECEFDETTDPVHNLHPWWDMISLSGEIAAPFNHQVILENPRLSILNVYQPADTWESFHAHPYFAIFVSRGSSFDIIDHDENGGTRRTPEQEHTPTMDWQSFVAKPPEWLHAAEALNPEASWDTAANCKGEDTPSDCAGFLYRFQFKHFLGPF